MALLDKDRRIFASSDWEIMQAAHERASRMLDRCPKTHPRCNELARTILTLFDSGIRDEEELAAMAANRELGVLAARGHFHKPFLARTAASGLTSDTRH
ncbi:hypothetical protein M8997_010495 [Phyllobacterium sp. 21LDTY02-6]|jgi:hypothetical protein|uniref:hypothetical protein n=1 Tax=unclassified Phyllobacterium TaxID=2638441 RepID=UPI002020C20F|nr:MULTISPECIES: hypothetical protein [unclassified Phyllobacterium]MCO4317614.1 hypothetical protein [Phyllobacterium sp. 21LDTY02-6]MCX8293013.1 hypothetical protein [Phyllobacterium sp. 0TCS1.6A]